MIQPIQLTHNDTHLCFLSNEPSAEAALRPAQIILMIFPAVKIYVTSSGVNLFLKGNFREGCCPSVQRASECRVCLIS